MRTLILLCSLATLSACGDKEDSFCTDIGCGEGNNTAWLELSDPAAGWAAEQDVTYRIFVSFDGTEEIRAGTPATGMWCDGEHVSVDPDTTDDGSVSLRAVVLTVIPDEIGLVIQRDDVEVVSQTFTPDPALSYPNGEGCEPVCATWTGSVDGW